MSDRSPRLLVIVGATASGKSALAIDVAKALDGEVISADSVQVYRGFDIGSGKLSFADRCGVPHHLIDVADAKETFSAARFAALADQAIRAIGARGRVPIIAGGTGLYVRALIHGLCPAPAGSDVARAEHERIRDSQGIEALLDRLWEVDPQTAEDLDPNDFVRISRALEVVEQGGVPISELRRAHRFGAQRYRSTMVICDFDRPTLHQRIERRTDQMIAAGWLDEVRQLIDAGYGECHAMGALGYRHLRAHLLGEYSLEHAVSLTKRDTRRFARRQTNWFKSERAATVLRGPVDPAELVALFSQAEQRVEAERR